MCAAALFTMCVSVMTIHHQLRASVVSIDDSAEMLSQAHLCRYSPSGCVGMKNETTYVSVNDVIAKPDARSAQLNSSGSSIEPSSLGQWPWYNNIPRARSALCKSRSGLSITVIIICFIFPKFLIKMTVLLAKSLNFAPTASKLISKGGPGGLTAALGATATRHLFRHARGTLPSGARCHSSKSPARDDPNLSRLVPIVAASTGLFLGALLYERGSSNSIKTELALGFHNSAAETPSDEVIPIVRNENSERN